MGQLTINPSNPRLRGSSDFILNLIPADPSVKGPTKNAFEDCGSCAVPVTLLFAGLFALGIYKGARGLGASRPVSVAATAISGTPVFGLVCCCGCCAGGLQAFGSLFAALGDANAQEAWEKWLAALDEARKQTDYEATWDSSKYQTSDNGELIADVRTMLQHLTRLSTDLHTDDVKWGQPTEHQIATETLAMMGQHARDFIAGIGQLNQFRASEAELTKVPTHLPQSEEPILAHLAALKSNFKYLEDNLTGREIEKGTTLPSAKSILAVDLDSDGDHFVPSKWIASPRELLPQKKPGDEIQNEDL